MSDIIITKQNNSMVTNNVAELVENIKALNKFQKNSIDPIIESLTKEEMDLFDTYIKHFVSTGLSIAFLAESYDFFCRETAKEQFYFMRNKKYRYSSFEETSSLVYFNKDYMWKYMHGIAVTLFLWEAHIEMRRFFEDVIPKDKSGTYLEVAAGHGLHLMRAMHLSAYDKFEGIDISPTSVGMTQAILKNKVFGDFDPAKYNIYEQDFFKMDEGRSYDAIVAGEVIEHIEDAVGFLKKINGLANPDAFIFVTTCINAPEPDHIFLFDSLEHLENIVNESGLKISNKCVVPHIGLTLSQAKEKLMPINIAMVLEKQ